jgi:hypothetical protein
MGKQLGWDDQGAFYDRAKRSALWTKSKGAVGFLQGLLAYEVFGGKYEVHQSSSYRKRKWYAFSLKGSTAPKESPKEQWIPFGGDGRRLPLTEHSTWRLSLTEHSTTGRVRDSIGGAPETAPETSREPPPPETPRAPPVLPDGENVTYMSSRSADCSKLQNIESVTVMIDELRQNRRKPTDFELHAALEVVNADRGSGHLAQLRAGNNKTVAVAVLTTPRGDNDVSSLST